MLHIMPLNVRQPLAHLICQDAWQMETTKGVANE
jgi:hypothetical protein